MENRLVNEAKKVLSGKNGRLDDEELEYLAKELTKLGFKLGFARAYAAGPGLVEKLVAELETKEKQLQQIKSVLGYR